MTEDNIMHVIDLYKKRVDVEKEAHLASYEEIEKNDYNLNVTRYIDTFEPEPEINLNDAFVELNRIKDEEEKISQEFNQYLKELGIEEQI